jgi:SAM-dependent methyltransferase
VQREDWDRRYADEPWLWSKTPNQFVVSELSELAPGHALDLAAGEGRNAVWLAQRGWNVVAVDFSDVAVAHGCELARREGVEIEWHLEDVREYVPEAQGFDLVLVIYLHLPWETMERVLGRASEAVAPGGTLLLVGHDRTNLEQGHGGPPDPAVLYSPEDVTQALEGLRIERAERVHRHVQTEQGQAVAIDNLVRAVRPPRS